MCSVQNIYAGAAEAAACPLSACQTTASAGILDKTVVRTGRLDEVSAHVPSVAQSLGMVAHKGAATALSDICSLSASSAGWPYNMGRIVMG